MANLGIAVDEQVNWENLLEISPEDLNFFDHEFPNLSNPSSDSLTLSVDEIEQLLMKDDDNSSEFQDQQLSDGFLSDFLLDSPVGGDGSGEVDDGSDGKEESVALEEQKNESSVDDHKEKEDKTDADPDDPMAKKRKRQLRNKDAALRSRERKKMYVRDLEMKSRYYEGECRRLGMVLQCVLSENQALHLSLHNSKAFDASMTKQESAVLLLESLLLGSLLWFLGIICLLILPRPLHPRHGPLLQETEENERPGSLVPRKVGSKFCGRSTFQSLLVGKCCKASRTRMKPSSHSLASFGV